MCIRDRSDGVWTGSLGCWRRLIAELMSFSGYFNFKNISFKLLHSCERKGIFFKIKLKHKGPLPINTQKRCFIGVIFGNAVVTSIWITIEQWSFYCNQIHRTPSFASSCLSVLEKLKPVQRRKWSPTANDPQTGNDPQIGPLMIPNRKWSPMWTTNDPRRKRLMAWNVFKFFFLYLFFIN